MKIFKIAISNIRRRKTGAVTFLMMSFIAVFMLSIAVTLFIGIGTFYDKKHTELQGSHYTALGQEELLNEFTKSQIEGSKYVKKWMQTKGYMIKADLEGSKRVEMKYLLLNADDFTNSSLYPLKYIEQSESIPEHAIVLPMGLKSEDIKIGDTIVLNIDHRKYEFQVYAFFEDIEMGASTFSMIKAYIFDDSVELMEKEDDFVKTGYMTARLNDMDDIITFRKTLDEPDNLSVVTYAVSKTASSSFINIMSIVLLLFSIIVLFIAFIVVRYNIITSMEEDIATLGALKSVGFTNRQLIGAQLLQYGILSVTGCILGILASFGSFGFIGNVIAGTSGLLWSTGINWGTMALSALLIIALCEAIIFIISQRTRKITPINALRQGDSHHSFKKNRLPLKKYRMPLLLHLAFKNIAGSVKINITLILVITLLSMTSAIMCVMNYNMEHPQAFHDMVGLEDADFMAFMFDSYVDDITEDVREYNDTEKIILFRNEEVLINSVTSNGAIYQDFSDSTAKDLYDGRKPTAENETAIGTSIASETKKTIGDTITMECFGVKKEYIVVGLVQGLHDGGRTVLFTLDGLQQHKSDVQLNGFAVVLSSGADKNEFEKFLKDKYEANIMITDLDAMLESVFEPMKGGINAAVIVMLCASAFIIAFILFLVINGAIRRDKKNYGIMKACGYTSRQLAIQLLLSYMPAQAVGSILGAVVSSVYTNDLLSLMFRAGGLNRTFFIVPVYQNMIVCILLFMISTAIVLLISLRIRKISAHKLIVEQ